MSACMPVVYCVISASESAYVVMPKHIKYLTREREIMKFTTIVMCFLLRKKFIYK